MRTLFYAILDEVFLDDWYDVSLYYFVENQNIDYELVRRIIDKTRMIISKNDARPEGANSCMSNFVFFYEYDEIMKPVIFDLFNKMKPTEKYFRESGDVSSITYGLFTVRSETDEFYLLDIYGTELDEKLRVFKHDKSISLEEFLEEFRRTSIYE